MYIEFAHYKIKLLLLLLLFIIINIIIIIIIIIIMTYNSSIGKLIDLKAERKLKSS